MSRRNTWRIIGLLLLLPSTAIGILPFIAGQTDVFSWASFVVMLGPHVIAEHRSGSSDIYANASVWIAAALGELLLIGIHLHRPVRKSRYSLRPY